MTKAVSTSLELWAQRDRDPSGHETQVSADVTATWQPAKLANLQLDIGGNVGLNRNTPDIELYSGIAWRF